MIAAAVILVLFSGWRIGRRTLFFAHMMQLEGYRSGHYLAWLRPKITDVGVRLSHLLALAWWLPAFLLGPGLPSSLIPVFFLLWAATFASSRRYRRDRPKKPIVFTPRMRRILAVTTVFILAILTAGIFSGDGLSTWKGAAFFAGAFGLADLLSPLILPLAVMMLEPAEWIIRNGFKRRARTRLRERPDLDIVAITGSYGKTSVKHAVAAVLGYRFPVLATPGSYNTPMGICRVVNDQLSAAHRILVLEMGIRHPGDIAELCDIAVPNIAIVTSVGVAHLESMGTVDAIAAEKGSLLSFVKPGGHAVLNADDDRVRAMGRDFDGTVWTVSCEGAEQALIRASDIRYGAEGARFVVTDETGDTIEMTTRLLGRHNVLNVLMAVAVGRIYGLRLRQLKRAVSELVPVPHRLEVRQESGVTIIDDAFNSNPVGARNAVEILGCFEGGTRFIVTPGMIELGDIEEQENREFGRVIARHADVALLVGPERTAPIAGGLREAGFPEDRLLTFRTLFEARDYLKGVVRGGDVVLYENDLPDQYNEG